jgi:hypothetical protein
MPKCFFSLKNSSDGFEASFGLAYFDEQSIETPADQARTIARLLREDSAYWAYSVVAMEQDGHEIARVPVAAQSGAPRLPNAQREQFAS